MSRYIDLDKAIPIAIQAVVDIVGHGISQVDAVYIADKLEEISTADVEEVRHGEWKQVSEKYPRYVCTSCNHLFNNKEYKYCPNCGAKMDGERREK